MQTSSIVFVAALFFCLASCSRKVEDGPNLTVSGISSGGYMAVQFHVAHSASVGGAGVVGGGPYWCAQDMEGYALSACMSTPMLIDLNTLYTATSNAAAAGTIDDTKNLLNDRVLLFSGTKDVVVVPGVMQKLQEYYQHYLSPSNIVGLFNFSCVHGMITLDYGQPCEVFGSPYINNCSYDLAGAFLQQIYGPLNPPAAVIDSNFVKLNQSEFVPTTSAAGWPFPSSNSLNDVAYAYYPSACTLGNGRSNCTKVHIAFHGCEMTIPDIQLQYVQDAGYNRWAESNNIIILYPQAVRSELTNPEGCWDWWGYTDSNYANKNGVQIATVYAMANAL